MASPAATPEPARTRSRRDWFALVGKISGVVSLIGAVVGLVFTLWPDAKPSPAPSERKATIGNLAVTPGLTFRQYLDRIDEDPGKLDRKTLDRPGAFLEFDLSATGYKGDRLRLRLQLIDTTTGDKVGERRATTVRPSAATDTIAWQDFLAFPAARRGPFQARVEVLDEEGVPLARARSDEFPAGSHP